jgi:hypothetical protein
MNNRNLAIITLLMLVSGLVIYYLYLKPEPFYVSTKAQTTVAQLVCPQATIPVLPVAILSRYFGVGFNLYPANGTTATSGNTFLIEHIPVVYNGSVGSMYAVTNGQLTIKLRNDLDPEQWWTVNRNTDSTSTYYTITPQSMANSNPKLAMQYENGNLSIRPLNTAFESQKWIYSNNIVTRGIPVLNYGPASLFTPEFNPFTSNNLTNTSSVNASNNQQVADVVNFIKTNIQQYLATVGASPSGNVPAISTSSLGNKEMPLNINVNMGSTGAALASSKSAFDNITGATTGSDLMSLLDKYETNKNPPIPINGLYSGIDLITALQNNQGCANVNIADYTSNRVSTCNCKL